jgi:hypothetical protein
MKEAISLSNADFEAAMNGDVKSAVKMLAMARTLCSGVEDFRQGHPEVAKTIARKLPDWPALVGRHAASVERIEALLKELELAEDHPSARVLAHEGKNMNLNDELNAVALDIWEWMNRFRRPIFSNEPDSAQFRALPAFSRATFKQWWKMGWEYYVKSVGGDPFNDRRLQRVRKRIEGTATSQMVSAYSRVNTEVRIRAIELWPRMAGL